MSIGAELNVVLIIFGCLLSVVIFGFNALCAIPDVLHHRAHLLREREGQFLIATFLANREPQCGRSPRERGARNAFCDAAESPRLVASPRTARVSTSAPARRPFFASDLTEATTSISAGQGDAT